MPSAVDHAEAALERLTLKDIASLPPARRRMFAERLAHWFLLIEGRHPKQPEYKAGVLAELKDGKGRE